MPTGEASLQVGELLQSDRLEQLFAVLRKQYDYIVVDAAQAIGISDAFVANRICEETLFVCCEQKSTEETAEFINQVAEQHRMKNIAAIYNGER